MNVVLNIEYCCTQAPEEDLPENLRHSTKKLKLYHAVETRDQHQFLNHDTQLIAKQDIPIFTHVNSQNPTNMLLGGKEPRTYEDLKSSAASLENALAAEIAEAHEAQKALDPMSAGVEHEASQAVTAETSDLLAGLDLTELAGQQAAPKKGTRKTKKEQSKPVQSTSLAAAAKDNTPPLLSLADSAPSGASVHSTGSKRRLGQDDEVSSLDAEMQVVARLHLSTAPRGASVKCLQSLVILSYTSSEKDHNRGHALAGAAASDMLMLMPRRF